MPKDKKETKGIVLSIKCKQGHISPYQPKDPDNIPSRIRCPHSIGGRPCKAACEVIDTLDKDPVELPTPKTTKIETPDPEPEVPEPTPEPKEKKVRGDRKSYDINFYTPMMSDVAKRTFDEIHNYIVNKGLKPKFTKYFILYKKDKKTVLQTRVSKKYIKLYFNSDKPVDNAKVDDISSTARGAAFKYMMSQIIYDDMLVVQKYIDESLE